jgi:hypothetical protein
MQDNYLAYCASDDGKATLDRRGLDHAPAHYSGLRTVWTSKIRLDVQKLI